jgi:D-alanyl-D-alanine carboxypeptidase/D-alanyl-D-alanine-endopeptidase (penicillin-binding protein 4)
MWKNSSNTQATSLLYAIGHRVNPKGEPTKAGVMYLKKILHEEIGIKDPAIVIHDGCGLCTHNHMSPKSLVLILSYGYKHKDIY